PVFGFLVIPRYGLTMPSIITGLAVGLIPFVKLIAGQRYISLGFIPVVLFSFWATKTHQPGKAVDVQYYSEGLLGQLLVADVSKDRFFLSTAPIRHGLIRKPSSRNGIMPLTSDRFAVSLQRNRTRSYSVWAAAPLLTFFKTV